ncbi:MAG: AAA family ATPase [Treponema sp.]|nr:AAA family ATPase [Treponema sp.]
MIQQEIKVKIPFLWGKAVFKKSTWNQINLIVGPNGSGKTLLAQAILSQFNNKGYKTEFIKTDRTSLENEILLLKNNEYIRSKVESILSNMFSKSVTFIEDIDKSLIPIVKNKAWNVEYMLQEAECHGLKEIIKLLVNLYDTSKNFLVFDEPELHLHPQFQMFFINEIRREMNLNPNRIIFLITHSPFFIDLKIPEDLLGVIVCHLNRIPSHIEHFSENDESLLRRFLPRFNTYHKQFFFSDNQIFVEGYTDQQLFSSLLSFLSDDYKTAGTSIIDVGGKDELGVFFKVCSLLGTNSRIITDLDSLFSGKLRDVICEDERCVLWLEKQEEKQKDFYNKIFTAKELNHKITLEKLIYKLEQSLIEIGQELTKTELQKNAKIQFLLEKLDYLKKKHENPEAVDTYKTVIYQGIIKQENELQEILPASCILKINNIKIISSLIFAAAEATRVYILHKGCIEHYYCQSNILYMPVSGKDKLFHIENDHILSSSAKTIKKDYKDLISLLKKAINN